MPYAYPVVCTLAGSDCSGGAGIQADLKTMTVLGCYGASVITALTAQNTCGVQGIFPVDSAFIASQLDSVFSDLSVDAVKIGMLHDAEVIATVARKLKEYNIGTVVLDPVMVATSGDRLLRQDAEQALREQLLPLATMITPNVKEAAILADMQVLSRDEMEQAAVRIRQLGAAQVLVKGGDMDDVSMSSDCALLGSGEAIDFTWFEGERIASANTHGTGCTLSSAIACFLAKGNAPEDAIAQAKTFLSQAIDAAAGLKLGKGRGPVDHLCRLKA